MKWIAKLLGDGFWWTGIEVRGAGSPFIVLVVPANV